MDMLNRSSREIANITLTALGILLCFNWLFALWNPSAIAWVSLGNTIGCMITFRLVTWLIW